MQYIIKPLEWIMNICYGVSHSYFIAIILFTLASKIILIPISVWVQNNSIKMVKMQPEINFAKVKFYGDRNRIAEEEEKIDKKYHYNAFASIIPMLIQLFLLIGVIQVIKAGIGNPNINMDFLNTSLAAVPSKEGGLLLLVPFIAAASAFLMCVCQNKSNVLQAEQSGWNQWITLIISVGLSLYLGFNVSLGVAVYWVFGNLFSIAQLYILNFFINPKKYVDYEQLEESRRQLAEIEAIGKESKKDPDAKKNAAREKADYKKFFSVVNKHLVFYSENNGFYKYYGALIEYLLDKTNITIHYITSDPNDKIFEKAENNNRIRAYYIGEKKLITLMMRMDADMVVMTMPDLNNYHIKRSYVRDDIEYLYIPHCMDSLNMTMREHSMDHFDSVLCAGRSQVEEISAIENEYGLKKKTLIECGYFLLDDMIEEYGKMEGKSEDMILIAPSWQDDNIVDSCLEELLDNLKDTGYKVVVRPHPQHVRHKKDILEKLKDKYADNEKIEVQLDFSATDTVWKAKLLITDWSGIAYEYAYCTHRPVLFINTPMKVMNPSYKRIDYVPINIAVREIFGASLDVGELDKAGEIVNNLISNSAEYEKTISDFVEKEIFNLGKSAEVGGRYIIGRLKEKSAKSK